MQGLDGDLTGPADLDQRLLAGHRALGEQHVSFALGKTGDDLFDDLGHIEGAAIDAGAVGGRSRIEPHLSGPLAHGVECADHHEVHFGQHERPEAAVHVGWCPVDGRRDGAAELQLEP